MKQINVSREEIKVVRQQVTAPVVFLSELIRLESLSVDQSSISAKGLEAYDRWHDYMWENWLGTSGTNFCAVVSSELKTVARQLDEIVDTSFDRIRDIESFEKSCEVSIAQQLASDNEKLQGQLYSRVFFEDQLSPRVRFGSAAFLIFWIRLPDSLSRASGALSKVIKSIIFGR